MKATVYILNRTQTDQGATAYVEVIDRGAISTFEITDPEPAQPGAEALIKAAIEEATGPASIDVERIVEGTDAGDRATGARMFFVRYTPGPTPVAPAAPGAAR